MEDTAAFFTTRSPEEAEAILASRRARYLLLTDPLTEAAELVPLAPPGAPPPVIRRSDWLRGASLDIAPDADDLVAARIYYDNGLSPRGLPSLGRYRLIYEGAPLGARQVRLFEFVPGANLVAVGVPAGQSVRATTALRTNGGRTMAWWASGVADATGRVHLRVPFSTGVNGSVVAGSYSIQSGRLQAIANVPAAAVERGESLVVRLAN